MSRLETGIWWTEFGGKRKRNRPPIFCVVAANPADKTVCDGRACRPGEGNAQGITHGSNPFDFRGGSIKSTPHEPDPASPLYAPLAAAAKDAAFKGLVYMCAADYDFREIASNWMRAFVRLGLKNALVYALDAEAHAHLTARGVRSVDGSLAMADFNRTRLARHIQRAEAERHLAAAAVAASGVDVLLMDCSHVLLRDAAPLLHEAAHSVDVSVPRGNCDGRTTPRSPAGCNPNWLAAPPRTGSLRQRDTRLVLPPGRSSGCAARAAPSSAAARSLGR